MPHSNEVFGFESCVLENVSSMLAYWDRDLRCRYANRAYETWFGVSARSLLGTSIRDLLGPALFAQNEPYMRLALEGHPQVFERVVPGPAGARHSLARYSPYVHDGAVVGFIVEVTDVTPLKEAQAALQAEISGHRRALDLVRRKDAALEVAQKLGKIGSWHWEIDHDITTWSLELCRIFGHDPTRLPPPLVAQRDLFTPASWALLESALSDAVSRGQSYVIELEYVHASGHRGWIEARGEPERDAAGDIVGLHGTAQEVSERRQLLELLKRRDGRFVLAANAARLGVWCWNADDDSVTWEHGIPARIIGGSEPESAVEVRRWTDVVHRDDLAGFTAALTAMIAGGEDIRFVGRVRRRNADGLRWIEMVGRAQAAEGPAASVVGTITDVTARVGEMQRLEERIADLTDLFDRRTDFLNVLAHELRNFLMPLSMGMALVRVNESRETTVRMHEIMARQVAAMTRLVDDLFDLRAIDAGELTLRRDRVSLLQVVETAAENCRAVADAAGHGLTVAGEHGLYVLGDEIRLVQMVCNLLTNAIKFTPTGGMIRVAIVHAEAGFAEIAVMDDGIGMNAAALLSVFGLYVREGSVDTGARSAGLGIGLHLVRRIAQAHGGSVHATSPGPERGSTLTVRLPLADG